jgi:DNA-binding protein HU-beta
MNKIEFIEKLAVKSGISKKEAEHFVNSMVDLVIDTLKSGSEVTITGFGTFSARDRHARMGVNPQNPKEPMKIPSVTVPKFKAGKTLKDALKTKDK